jgi:hypothetical protein
VTHSLRGRSSAPKDGASSSDLKSTIGPVTRQVPVPQGFARQLERQTTVKGRADGRTGAFTGAKKGGEIADNPGAGGGGIFDAQVDFAEEEEAGKQIGDAFKEQLGTWAHGNKPKEEGGEPASGGEAEPAEAEPAEADPYSTTTTSISQEHGYTKTVETTVEHGHGTEAAVGDWAADPELFKAMQILAFADEHREGEGGKKGTTHKAVAGAEGQASVKAKSRKGATRQEFSAEAKGLAGVRAAAKTLAVADDKELTAAVTALAQAGAFGEAGTRYDVKRGRAALAAWTKTSGGAGVQARGRAVASVDKNPLLPTAVAFFEGAVQAGIWADIEAGVQGSYGPLIARAKTKISGFAGAAAEAKGAVLASPLEGIGVMGQASAKAGAEGSITNNQTLAIEGLGELEFEQGAMVFAGAMAKAKGKATISLTGITLQGKASAFAGVKSSAWASVAGKIRGREVIKVGVTGGVSVGAGVAVGGTFSFQRGKLVLAGDIAAALKLGADMGGKLELDLAALGTAILQTVADQYNKEQLQIDMKGADWQREDLKDDAQATDKKKEAYRAAIDLFDDYAADVMTKVRSGKMKGTVCLDAGHLQKLVQKAAQQGGLRATYKETDRGIEEAARDAFGELLDPAADPAIMVDALVIRSLRSRSPAAAKKEADEYATLAEAKKARSALQRDLQEYAGKKAKASATAAHRYTVQHLLTKHWKALSDAFPGAEAPTVAKDVVTATLGRFLMDDDGQVDIEIDTEGEITRFPSIDARIARGEATRAELADDATAAKFDVAKEKLGSQLQGYVAGLVAGKNQKPDQQLVQRLFDNATSAIKGELLDGKDKERMRGALLETLGTGLGRLADNYAFVGDSTKLQALGWNAAELAKARDGKAAETAAAKRQQELQRLTDSVSRRLQRGVKSKRSPADVKFSILEALIDDVPRTAGRLRKLDGANASPDAIDQDIHGAINGVLGDLFEVKVAHGQITMDSINAHTDEAKYREQQRKAKATLTGGEEQDNARRKLVADAVREPFRTYATQVRGAIDREVADPGTAKVKPVEKQKLQNLIDKNLGRIRADVQGEVGDDALLHAAAVHFGVLGEDGKPMPGSAPGPALLKKFRTHQLKITDDFQAASVQEAANGKRADQVRLNAEKRAADRLAAALRTLARDHPRQGFTTEVVQPVVRKVVAGLPAASVDTVVLKAFSEVFGPAVAAMDVKDGRLTALKIELSFWD